MTFTTRPYIKYVLPIILIFGVLLLVVIYSDFNTKTVPQQQAIVWLTIIDILFFFGLPLLTINYFKVFKYSSGKWTVKYPYLNKCKTVNRDTVNKIQILENISGRYVPNYSQINIKLKDGSSIYINSLETNNFKKVLKLFNKDFNGLIERPEK